MVCAGRVPPFGEVDPFGPLVGGVVFAGEIVELFELFEEVAHCLPRHTGLDRNVRGASALGWWVAKDGEVRGQEVGEAGVVEGGDHPLADRVQGRSEYGCQTA
jgi:hypothetical protein